MRSSVNTITGLVAGILFILGMISLWSSAHLRQMNDDLLQLQLIEQELLLPLSYPTWTQYQLDEHRQKLDSYRIEYVDLQTRINDFYAGILLGDLSPSLNTSQLLAYFEKSHRLKQDLQQRQEQYEMDVSQLQQVIDSDRAYYLLNNLLLLLKFELGNPGPLIESEIKGVFHQLFQLEEVIESHQQRVTDLLSEFERIVLQLDGLNSSVDALHDKNNLAYAREMTSRIQAYKTFSLRLGIVMILLTIAGCLGMVVYRNNRRQEHLKNELDQARQIVASSNNFMHNVAQELRTPLLANLGFQELMARGSMNKTQADNLRNIRVSSESLMLTINDFLDFTRLESGNLILDNSQFNLNKPLRKVANMLSDIAARDDIEILIFRESDVSRMLWGDPYRLSQVLVNLVGSAVRSELKGDLEIRVSLDSQDPDRLIFSLIEPGMDWEMKELIAMAWEALGPLNEDEKYCLKLPIVLGGLYEQKNMGKIAHEELLRFSGTVGMQLKDVPDGGNVSFNILD